MLHEITREELRRVHPRKESSPLASLALKASMTLAIASSKMKGSHTSFVMEKTPIKILTIDTLLRVNHEL